MNFIKNLVSRHTESAPTIQPRLSSRFELSAEPPTEQRVNPIVDNPIFSNPQDATKLDSPVDPMHSAANRKIGDVQTHVFNRTPRSDEVFPLKQHPSKVKNNPSFSDQSDSMSTPKEHENKVLPIFSLEKQKTESNNNKIDRNRKPDNATPAINPKMESGADHQTWTPNAREEESSPRPTVKPKELPASVFNQVVNTVTPVLGSGKEMAELKRQMNLPKKHSQRQLNSNPPSPTIKVNIGRIEVRATTEQAKPPVMRRTTPKPNMSLEDYLKKQR